MRLIDGRSTIDDLDAFLDRLRTIGDRHGATVQAFDARYVAGQDHLRHAVTLAQRAHERDDAIADDLAVEILCYAAGRRQIDDALEMGVDVGSSAVVLVVVGGDVAGAVDDLTSAFHLDLVPAGTDDEAIADGTDDASVGEEPNAVGAAATSGRPDRPVDRIDEDRLCDFFDVGEDERSATDVPLPLLVRERVTLLVVEK